MAYNTIKLKKYSDVVNEYEAAAALYPGYLVELTSAGAVQAHSTAEGNVVPKMFALEDELQGKGIDDAYAAGDQVQVWCPTSGDEVYAVLADGQTAAIGSVLESAGDGTLQVHVADADSADSFDSYGPLVTVTVRPEAIVGVALEAVDLSDSSGAEDSGTLDWDKRIKIRIV